MKEAVSLVKEAVSLAKEAVSLAKEAVSLVKGAVSLVKEAVSLVKEAEASFSPKEGQNRAKEGKKRAKDISKASEAHHAIEIGEMQSQRDDMIREKETIRQKKNHPVLADTPPVEGNYEDTYQPINIMLYYIY